MLGDHDNSLKKKYQGRIVLFLFFGAKFYEGFQFLNISMSYIYSGIEESNVLKNEKNIFMPK